MSKLKTINISGHAYFVTSKVTGNKNLLIHHKYCLIVIDTLKFMRRQGKFRLLGYALMPNHTHLIIWPTGKYTISDIMRDFKKFVSKSIIEELKRDSLSEKTRSPDLVLHVESMAGQETRHSRWDDQDREVLAPRPELDGKVFKQAGLGTCHSLGEGFIPQFTNDSSARRGRLAFSVGVHGENQAPRPDLNLGDERSGLGTRPSQLLTYFKEKARDISGQNYKVWMSRSWIENIYSDKFLEQKLEYIHQNPVRAGFVKDPVDWKYSSARNYYLNDHSLIKIDLI